VPGLRWRDIDWEQRTITARGQLQWLEVELDKPRQPVWVPSPKSRAGKRVIDIWQKLADILKTWRRSQREERLILGPRWHGEDYVFTSEEGWQSARATSIAALNMLSSAPSCSRRWLYTICGTVLTAYCWRMVKTSKL
jgi:integrase